MYQSAGADNYLKDSSVNQKLISSFTDVPRVNGNDYILNCKRNANV